ncbi:Uncharacterised protein [Mycobacteroides abscessus subsp. bolletii]|nr:Uncharacterised protein [Mycobacteroides abscessus subsp. bolletii]
MVDPGLHGGQELCCVLGQDHVAIGGFVRDRLTPRPHSRDAGHSGSSRDRHAVGDVVHAEIHQREGPSADPQEVQPADELRVTRRGHHRHPRPSRPPDQDGWTESRHGEQSGEGLGPQSRFRLMGERDVGVTAVRPVPAHDTEAQICQGRREFRQPTDVHRIPAAGGQHDPRTAAHHLVGDGHPADVGVSHSEPLLLMPSQDDPTRLLHGNAVLFYPYRRYNR